MEERGESRASRVVLLHETKGELQQELPKTLLRVRAFLLIYCLDFNVLSPLRHLLRCTVWASGAITSRRACSEIHLLGLC